MDGASEVDKMFSDPVIFTLPGHATDTRLQVFDTEFHVHSVILKIGSTYFRKFLDSADKAASSPTATFRYEYVTVVDDDGKTWGLEAESKVEARGPEMALKSPSLQEAFGMKYMLDSMYGKPFELRNLQTLQTLARLADFYGAVPTLSNALDGALVRSPNLIAEIPHTPLEFLTIARMLRNKILYKESMIHVAGQWKGQHTKLADKPELRKHAIIAYSSLCDKLDTANQGILTIIGKKSWSGDNAAIADRVQHHASPWTTKNVKSLASYYRKLYEDEYEITEAHGDRYNCRSYDAIAKVQTILSPVLQNNLVLERSKDGAGQGKFENCFLCADVPDEDLPWDLMQSD